MQQEMHGIYYCTSACRSGMTLWQTQSKLLLDASCKAKHNDKGVVHAVARAVDDGISTLQRRTLRQADQICFHCTPSNEVCQGSAAVTACDR
jgi:hypothetical protein